MKAYTTYSKAERLVKAGLNTNTADMYYAEGMFDKPVPHKDWMPRIAPYKEVSKMNRGGAYGNIFPCWSLTALLNIIDNNGLIYDISNDKNREFEVLVYKADYTNQEVKFHHTEHFIIDMIIWLLKNNYIKKAKEGLNYDIP